MNFTRSSRFLAAAALLVMATVTALAQKKPVGTGPKYDVANEVKIKGVIEDIREVPGDFEGTHLVVRTDTGTVLVHLAPADFLKEIDSTFKKGDEVQVVGCKAPNTSENEIMAREITVGTNTTTLRDDKGIPVWAGWKPAKN
jgi:DNA/RNA endonuclease YhcR with UshA esterase domain